MAFSWKAHAVSIERLFRLVLFSPEWWSRLVLLFVACLLAWWVEFARPDYVVRLDEIIRDTFLQLVADRRPEERLTIVDISEDSLAEIGAWPWSRSQIADLSEMLIGQMGARAVALDIVFPTEGDAAGDARLASLAAHAPLVLSQVFHYVSRNDNLAQGVLSGGRVVGNNPGLPVGLGYIANHAGLSGSACTGNIGYFPDADGVLRRLPALTYFQGEVFSHLSFALLACFPPSVASGIGADVSTLLLNAKSSGYWRVPFHRDFSAYAVVSAADVLRERVSSELFRGRYVLVGSSALGAGDRASTPFSPVSPGVMVHAENISSLLDIAEGERFPPWQGGWVILSWAFATVFFLMFVVTRSSALQVLIVLMGLVFAWICVAFAAVVWQMDGVISAPLVSYFVVLLFGMPFEWWRSQRKTRHMLDMLAHYVAKPVLNEIMKRPSAHSVVPSLRDVTVLIADMEGYTRMTSSLSLDDAACLTKEFLDCLTRPVLFCNGTLDKYTGDGLVAFWGAPLDCPDQADRAVAAALRILDEVSAWNSLRAKKNAGEVRVRIGIESGRALVGDLGTPFRSTYTAVGDCINFASRLESAAGELHTSVVIGPVANALLSEHGAVSLGRHVLRGTSTEIELFTPPSCQLKGAQC